jgi:hypothetical protein
LHNEITGRLANELQLELFDVEARRPADRSDVLDHVLRGRAILARPLSRSNYAEAIGHYERALALDPDSVDVP